MEDKRKARLKIKKKRRGLRRKLLRCYMGRAVVWRRKPSGVRTTPKSDINKNKRTGKKSEKKRGENKEKRKGGTIQTDQRGTQAESTNYPIISSTRMGNLPGGGKKLRLTGKIRRPYRKIL